jgi:hypothetical protein
MVALDRELLNIGIDAAEACHRAMKSIARDMIALYGVLKQSPCSVISKAKPAMDDLQLEDVK